MTLIVRVFQITPVEGGTAVDTPKRRGWETGAKAAYWFSNVDGDLRIDGNGIRGSAVRLEDDLDISKAESGTVEIFGRCGRHRLTAGCLESEYSGSTHIPRESVSKGQTCPAGSRGRGQPETHNHGIGIPVRLSETRNVPAGLSVGAIGKVLYTEGQTSGQAPALGLSGQGCFYATVPMLGIGFQPDLLADWLEYCGKVSGSRFPGSPDGAT